MNKKYDRRVVSVYLIFLFVFFIISLKIIYLQAFKSSFFQSLAKSQHYRLLRLEGKRGKILDRQKRTLATGINCYSIFADPFNVSDKESTAVILSTNLDLSKEALLAKLNKKKRFVWVERKVSWEEKERIESFNLKGVGFIREEKRFYPENSLLSSVIGIVDIDNKGLEGLELFYNNYLSGKDGWVRVLQDSSSREITLSPKIVTPQRGADIVLTVDAQIQYWAESCLEEVAGDYKAKAGSLVVMDASSGEILALANHPGFNPNRPILSGSMKNGAICDMFEPGSVFKAVTLLAAVSEDKFSDEDKIFCENGRLKIPGTVLHDWKSYGELTFREVFVKSSNIGVAKIADSLGADTFLRYTRRLGFGKLSGIDLPGEIRGRVKSLGSWSKTSKYIIPIGQEVGVNFLQLIRAFAAIVNEGYLVEPHVVKDVCSRGFCKSIRFAKKKIFSSAVTKRARNILVDVVENGTGRRAGIKGREIGGKTGTAQKYDLKIKRYSSTKYRATFVGFLADLKPPLVIGVTIDEPKKSHFGGVVAAPAFRKIAKKVIKYIEGEKSLAKRPATREQ